MQTLAIDIETYSGSNLTTGGVYRYVDDPNFTVLLLAYSVDDGPVHIIDIASGQPIPAHIVEAISNPTVTKWAFNANFERTCLGRYLHQQGFTETRFLNPAGWRCSMVWAMALGYPNSLKEAARSLALTHQKMGEGKNLIKLFCTPQNTAGGLFEVGSKGRILPGNAPTQWKQFTQYCIRDVEAENELRHRLAHLPLPESVWVEYETDQQILDHGVMVDTGLVGHAIEADDYHHAWCMDAAREATGLANPNSPTQLLAWLREEGYPLASLAKQNVADLLADSTLPKLVRHVLQLRQELSRSSVKKYVAMRNTTCSDGRAHGLTQFYGAGRTGRWAGRLIQVQNLPRNRMPDLDVARGIVRGGHTSIIETLFDDVPDTLSQLIRTALIPKEGHKFIVADYSAIEARVLAWLSGQTDTLHAFKEGKDLYCETATKMFGVPVEKHGANSELRQKGKIAVLACGYQGGVGALRAMGATRMGIPETELQPIVDAWRRTNRKIVNYWRRVEEAALQTVLEGTTTWVRNIRFTLRSTGGAPSLVVWLPSGRPLVYPRVKTVSGRFGAPSLQFMGAGTGGTWLEDTYGGKLVENITQAVARDILAHALNTLTTNGFRVVMHVHDEAVVEALPHHTVADVCALMTQAPTWAKGLPIAVDGFECDYYQKD